jgi:Kef-type K+ transport system membrane component KefB
MHVISDTSSFLIVLLVAAAAPIVALWANKLMPSVIVPIAVVELVLGAVVGPHGLKGAHQGTALELLETLGLGFLFFFAGYEIDFDAIRGWPLRLGLIGWGLSVVIAYTFAGLLAAAGVVISGLLTGSAMSTTAIGTILPVLRDSGQLKGRFGPGMLAAGAVGELGPVLIVTLLLTTKSNSVSQALLLAAFIVVTLVAALLSSGATGRAWGFLSRSLHTSGQEPVRLTVLLVFGLVLLADSLGLDVILGAFAAGIIVRHVLRGREAHRFESKLEAVGFGFLIPFFFISSGMNLDLGALASSVGAVLKVPLFLFGFLLVRGLPALLLYRSHLSTRDRVGMALLSATQLPLVVAITSLGVAQGQMRQSTAVALVTAGVLSVLLFPTIAIAVRKRSAQEPEPEPAAQEQPMPAGAGLEPAGL